MESQIIKRDSAGCICVSMHTAQRNNNNKRKRVHLLEREMRSTGGAAGRKERGIN